MNCGLFGLPKFIITSTIQILKLDIMENKYAGLFTRVKAVIIDNIAIIILMYSATEIFNLITDVPNAVRVIVFVLIFLLYEPILVSTFGATIGHFFNDIVVKREANEEKNINFFFAIGRFITKVLLGWISLLTINGNDKKKAIHDYV